MVYCTRFTSGRALGDCSPQGPVGSNPTSSSLFTVTQPRGEYKRQFVQRHFLSPLPNCPTGSCVAADDLRGEFASVCGGSGFHPVAKEGLHVLWQAVVNGTGHRNDDVVHDPGLVHHPRPLHGSRHQDVQVQQLGRVAHGHAHPGPIAPVVGDGVPEPAVEEEHAAGVAGGPDLAGEGRHGSTPMSPVGLLGWR